MIELNYNHTDLNCLFDLIKDSKLFSDRSERPTGIVQVPFSLDLNEFAANHKDARAKHYNRLKSELYTDPQYLIKKLTEGCYEVMGAHYSCVGRATSLSDNSAICIHAIKTGGEGIAAFFPGTSFSFD